MSPPLDERDKRERMYSRLTVLVVENGAQRRLFDVGEKELDLLLKTCSHVEVLQWGRYGEDGYAHDSDEHKRILKMLEENKC